MLDDLSEAGISHGDFRWANIVNAPKSSSGLRGRRCPKHGVRHKWRFVDFELSKKTGSPAWRLMMEYEHTTDEMFRHLARRDRMC